MRDSATLAYWSKDRLKCGEVGLSVVDMGDMFDIPAPDMEGVPFTAFALDGAWALCGLAPADAAAIAMARAK